MRRGASQNTGGTWSHNILTKVSQVLRVIIAIVCETKFVDVILASSQFHGLGCSVASATTVVVTVVVSILD